MCWATPGIVIEVKPEDKIAVVDFGGVRYEVIVGIDDVKPGDIVLVHAGLIISKVDPETIKETMELMKELEEFYREALGQVETTQDLSEDLHRQSSEEAS